MLEDNALTTLETLKYELKLYSTVTATNETLTDSGDHLTFLFAKKNIVSDSIVSVTETVGATTTNVTALISAYDYKNGEITFASARTGTIKTTQYQYNKFDNSKDEFLERKINSYSEWLEGRLGRKLSKDNYIEKYCGNSRQYLLLNQWPIIIVNSIKIDGGLLDNTSYETSTKDKKAGMIFKEDGWPWDGYLTGLVGEPLNARRNIEVDYDAGYILPKDATDEEPRTLPYDIEELLIGIIASDYSKYGSQGLKSFKISDVEWQWDNELKQQYKEIMDKYIARIV